MKAFGEFHEVNLSILIGINTHQNVIDVLAEKAEESSVELPVFDRESFTWCTSSELPSLDGTLSEK